MFDGYLLLNDIFIQFFSPDFHLLFAPGPALRLFQNPTRPSEANLGKWDESQFRNVSEMSERNKIRTGSSKTGTRGCQRHFRAANPNVVQSN